MGYLHVPQELEGDFLTNIFSQTATKTITNTTSETTLLGAGSGGNTIAANYFTVGKTLDIRTSGIISGQNNHTATVRVYFGGVKLVESIATMPTTFTNAEFQSVFTLTYRGNNKFIGQGHTLIMAGVGLSTAYFRDLKMTAEATIDISQVTTFDLTYQWGTASASDSVSTTNCIANIIG